MSRCKAFMARCLEWVSWRISDFGQMINEDASGEQAEKEYEHLVQRERRGMEFRWPK